MRAIWQSCHRHCRANEQFLQRVVADDDDDARDDDDDDDDSHSFIVSLYNTAEDIQISFQSPSPSITYFLYLREFLFKINHIYDTNNFNIH